MKARFARTATHSLGVAHSAGPTRCGPDPAEIAGETALRLTGLAEDADPPTPITYRCKPPAGGRTAGG